MISRHAIGTAIALVMSVKDTIANIRTAIVYSKRAGNEGQCLANSKGQYRPVAEVLTPALEQLSKVEDVVKELEQLRLALLAQGNPLSTSLSSIINQIKGE